jgi:2,4-dienoyl-CoA reductase-like NADH-dependent reductase (Old Yellow Enzyme family)
MECNDGDEIGNPSARTLERYRRFARAGPGVLFVESCTVTRESRGRIHQLGVSAETADRMAALVRAMREENPEPLILFQISHDGSRGNPAFTRVASPLPTDRPNVRTLSGQELEAIEELYAEAARIVHEIGADGIDFKNCHGYLACELLRPANTREGRFGGSFENRTVFFWETVAKIRDRIRDPAFLVGARISAIEELPGGFGTGGPGATARDLAEPVALARRMEAEGLHYVNVSVTSVPNSHPTRARPELVSAHFEAVEAIKGAVGIPVMGAGYSMLRDGGNALSEPDPAKKSFLYWAERNLAEGRVDMVGVGRQTLADPLFAGKILAGAVGEIEFCTACQGCVKLLAAQREVGCTVHDPQCRESLRELRRAQGQGDDAGGGASPPSGPGL